MTQNLTLTKPDDWHIHLRDGKALLRTVLDASQRYSRVMVMPNLNPPITEIKQAAFYQKRILDALPQTLTLQPLMSLYLTDKTPREIIAKAKESTMIHGCKLYPHKATTHADYGVSTIENLYEVFAAMEKHHLTLQLHGEIPDKEIDIFDREKYFIEKILSPLIKRFTHLPIVLEHISTKEAVDFVKEAPTPLAATMTAHHLLLNRNDLFSKGIHPHYYCLPILKRRCHQEALIQAAISGNPRFFLGTDSAPHGKNSKEGAWGCAGIYTGYCSLELYAEIFEKAKALDKLEGFASFYGADFYHLPRNQDKITLTKQAWEIPNQLPLGDEEVIPFRAKEKVSWRIKDAP
jgi:dihydroorotase